MLSAIIQNRLKKILLLIFCLPVLTGIEYTALSILYSVGGDGDGNFIGNYILGIFNFESEITTIFLIICIFILRTCFGFIHKIQVISTARGIQKDLNTNIYKDIVLEEEISNIYDNGAGHYISLSGEQAGKAGNLFISMMSLVEGVMTSLAALFILVTASYIFGFIFLTFSIFSGIFIYSWFLKISNLGAKEFKYNKIASSLMVETLNSVKSIRSLSSENYIVKTYYSKFKNVTGFRILIEAYREAQKTIPGLILLIIAAIAFNPFYPLLDSINPIFVVMIIIIVIRLMTSLALIIAGLSNLYADLPVLKALNNFKIPQKSKLKLVDRFKDLKTLELNEITFSYNKESIILNKINYIFHSGKTYSVCGPSGTGKSTLMDIIVGFLEPDSGNVLFNSSIVDRRVRRNEIRFVDQSPKLFSMSIRDNIALGMNISDKRINELVDMVQLGNFISSLDNGIDTVLDYQSQNISGGQIQRVAIARALARDPSVLILDETTTGLDETLKNDVVESIKSSMSDGILIFVTHDMHIAHQVDDILQLSNNLNV